MLDKLQKALNDATDFIKDQANTLGDSAKGKAFEVIDDWIKIFPQLENYGLKVNSFAMGIAISPSVEAELVSSHEQFPPERLEQILEEVKGQTAISSVFSTIRTAYTLHRRINAELKDPLIVVIKIKISPEVKVYIGEPIIQ
ncbi:MAG: hypothetical protein AAF242_00975 [Bacteroidota bacterium]